MGSLRLRKLGGGQLSLRGFRFPTGRTVWVLRRTGLRVPRPRYSGSLRLRKFGLSAGAIFRVPQAEGSSRYLGIAAPGDSVFLWVKGLVVPEADEMRAPFRLGRGFLKAVGIWSLPAWNLQRRQ